METTIAEGHVAAIKNAASMDVLKHAYQDAYRAARDMNDEVRMSSFQLAYEARKTELNTPVTV
jgi:hypothetical protein